MPLASACQRISKVAPSSSAVSIARLGTSFARGALILGDAQQPIERHGVALGDLQQRLDARQAGRFRR